MKIESFSGKRYELAMELFNEGKDSLLYKGVLFIKSEKLSCPIKFPGLNRLINSSILTRRIKLKRIIDTDAATPIKIGIRILSICLLDFERLYFFIFTFYIAFGSFTVLIQAQINFKNFA